MIVRVALLSFLLLTGISFGQEGTYYEGQGLFSTRPSETKSIQEIKRFGPVGLSLELYQPAFVIKIKSIEKGSPAEETGRLKGGQIINTFNGQKLAKIDPRIQLGQILAAAEATDGLIQLSIEGEAQPVTVRIPVLGSYSKTWPLDCSKSDKIVRQVADYLTRPKSTEGLGGIGMLFLLSTGDDKDLEFVRNWPARHLLIRTLGMSAMVAFHLPSVICVRATKIFC